LDALIDEHGDGVGITKGVGYRRTAVEDSGRKPQPEEQLLIHGQDDLIAGQRGVALAAQHPRGVIHSC
jgi:hypothetical protein